MTWKTPKKPSVPSSRIPKSPAPTTPDGVAHTIRGLACGGFIAVTKRGEWLYVPQELRSQLPRQIWGNNSFRAQGWFSCPSEAHLVIGTIGASLGYSQEDIGSSRRFLVADSMKEFQEVARSIPPQLLAEWKQFYSGPSNAILIDPQLETP